MKGKRLSSDRISTLPANVIDTILCFVPIRDAVRTSILSRNWRYNWNKIPKLVFNDEDMFKKSSDDNQLSTPTGRKQHLSKRRKVFNVIDQVLLMHQGPVREFTLAMDEDDTYNIYVGFDHIDKIIFHLCKNNTLKKLTLDLNCETWYTPPVSVFSLHQLTDLDFRECDLDLLPSTFNVCGSLTSLYLENVYANTKTIIHLISKSPLLKSLTLVGYITGEENGLVYLPYFLRDDTFTIGELFGSLPVIEHLFVTFWVIKCFVGDAVPRELPISLVHLKYFYLDFISFKDKYALPLLFLLIRCSPNVEKIKLQMTPEHTERYTQSEIGSDTFKDYSDTLKDYSEIDAVTLEDYSDIWLEHLNDLEIEEFTNLKVELEFVKLILSKSPVLKKVSIVFDKEVAKDEELETLRILLCSPHASPVVKIFVERLA